MCRSVAEALVKITVERDGKEKARERTKVDDIGTNGCARQSIKKEEPPGNE